MRQKILKRNFVKVMVAGDMETRSGKLPECRFDLVEQPHRLRPTARLCAVFEVTQFNRKVRAALIHERNGFAELLERQIKVLVVGNTFLIPEIGAFAAVMYIRRPAER